MASHIISATRLTLIFINILFVILGIACMAVGGWVLIYREEVRELTMLDVATDKLGLLQNAAILLITSGILLFALGFLGCLATYRAQKCARVLYIGLIILCLILGISACALVFMFRDKVEETLADHLQTRLKTEYEGFSKSTVDFSQAMDYAQVEFECCGVRSWHDFNMTLKWTVRDSASIPPSCCKLDRDAYRDENVYTLTDRDCVQFPTTTNSNINQDCYTEIKDWLDQETTVIGGVAIAAIVLQVLSLLFTVVLMKQIQQKDMDSTQRYYRDGQFDSLSS